MKCKRRKAKNEGGDADADERERMGKTGIRPLPHCSERKDSRAVEIKYFIK